MSLTLASLDAINSDWVEQCMWKCLAPEDRGVESYTFQQIGEGIGQLGSFGILEVETQAGTKRSFFLKDPSGNKRFSSIVSRLPVLRARS